MPYHHCQLKSSWLPPAIKPCCWSPLLLFAMTTPAMHEARSQANAALSGLGLSSQTRHQSSNQPFTNTHTYTRTPRPQVYILNQWTAITTLGLNPDGSFTNISSIPLDPLEQAVTLESFGTSIVLAPQPNNMVCVFVFTVCVFVL